jgi:hypothetical protein
LRLVLLLVEIDETGHLCRMLSDSASRDDLGGLRARAPRLYCYSSPQQETLDRESQRKKERKKKWAELGTTRGL